MPALPFTASAPGRQPYHLRPYDPHEAARHLHLIHQRERAHLALGHHLRPCPCRAAADRENEGA